jgi:protocatechuate 3,4-dioxygenase beta subunit
MLVAACGLLAGSQQAPGRDAALPAGTAVLSGTIVTDDRDARPVRRAQVQLRSADNFLGALEVISDDTGSFTFAGVRAGRYQLSASKPGMVSVSLGARRPGGPGSAVAISDGQQITGLTVRMSRGAVIAGTVRDSNGEPARGVRVHVMRYGRGWQTGERELQPANPGFGIETDDRGQYRVYGLPPGEYLVVVAMTSGPARSGTDVHQTTAADVQWAMRQVQDVARTGTTFAPPAAGPNVDYAPIFHPGTTVQADAGMIPLGAGEERSGVDIPLLLVPTSKIEGVVTAPDGPPPANLQVNLLAHQRISGLPFSGFGSAPAVTDGKFTVSGLLPGDYTITVRPRAAPGGRSGAAGPAASASDLFAIEVVTVSGTDVNVTLPLRAGVTVSGRLAFDATTLVPPADLSKARVNLSAVVTGAGAVLGVSAATVDAAGAFTFRGVTPGRYRITASVPGATPTTGWQQRSAVVDGRDTLDAPFEVRASDVDGAVVTFTDRPAELSGVIQDPAGKPAPEYFVIVFARDRVFWTPQSRRIQAIRPGNDGRFIFRNLPPGEYAIAAMTDVEQGEWFDPGFLTRLLPASTPITIAEGEKKVQDIRIVGLAIPGV